MQNTFGQSTIFSQNRQSNQQNLSVSVIISPDQKNTANAEQNTAVEQRNTNTYDTKKKQNDYLQKQNNVVKSAFWGSVQQNIQKSNFFQIKHIQKKYNTTEIDRSLILMDPKNIQTQKVVAKMQTQENQFNTLYDFIQSNQVVILKNHLSEQVQQHNDYFKQFDNFIQDLEQFQMEMNIFNQKASKEIEENQSSQSDKETINLLNQQKIYTFELLNAKEIEMAKLKREFYDYIINQVPEIWKKIDSKDQFLVDKFLLLDKIYYGGEKQESFKEFCKKSVEILNVPNDYELSKKSFKDPTLNPDQIKQYIDKVNNILFNQSSNTNQTNKKTIPIESLRYEILRINVINLDPNFFNDIKQISKQDQSSFMGEIFRKIFLKIIKFKELEQDKKAIQDSLLSIDKKILDLEIAKDSVIQKLQKQTKQNLEILQSNSQSFEVLANDLIQPLQQNKISLMDINCNYKMENSAKLIQAELDKIQPYIQYDEGFKKKQEELTILNLINYLEQIQDIFNGLRYIIQSQEQEQLKMITNQLQLINVIGAEQLQKQLDEIYQFFQQRMREVQKQEYIELKMLFEYIQYTNSCKIFFEKLYDKLQKQLLFDLAANLQSLLAILIDLYNNEEKFQKGDFKTMKQDLQSKLDEVQKNGQIQNKIEILDKKQEYINRFDQLLNIEEKKSKQQQDVEQKIKKCEEQLLYLKKTEELQKIETLESKIKKLKPKLEELNKIGQVQQKEQFKLIQNNLKEKLQVYKNQQQTWIKKNSENQQKSPNFNEKEIQQIEQIQSKITNQLIKINEFKSQPLQQIQFQLLSDLLNKKLEEEKKQKVPKKQIKEISKEVDELNLILEQPKQKSTAVQMEDSQKILLQLEEYLLRIQDQLNQNQSIKQKNKMQNEKNVQQQKNLSNQKQQQWIEDQKQLVDELIKKLEDPNKNVSIQNDLDFVTKKDHLQVNLLQMEIDEQNQENIKINQKIQEFEKQIEMNNIGQDIEYFIDEIKNFRENSKKFKYYGQAQQNKQLLKIQQYFQLIQEETKQGKIGNIFKFTGKIQNFEQIIKEILEKKILEKGKLLAEIYENEPFVLENQTQKIFLQNKLKEERIDQSIEDIKKDIEEINQELLKLKDNESENSKKNENLLIQLKEYYEKILIYNEVQKDLKESEQKKNKILNHENDLFEEMLKLLQNLKELESINLSQDEQQDLVQLSNKIQEKKQDNQDQCISGEQGQQDQFKEDLGQKKGEEANNLQVKQQTPQSKQNNINQVQLNNQIKEVLQQLQKIQKIYQDEQKLDNKQLTEMNEYFKQKQQEIESGQIVKIREQRDQIQKFLIILNKLKEKGDVQLIEQDSIIDQQQQILEELMKNAHINETKDLSSKIKLYLDQLEELKGKKQIYQWEQLIQMQIYLQEKKDEIDNKGQIEKIGEFMIKILNQKKILDDLQKQKEKELQIQFMMNTYMQNIQIKLEDNQERKKNLQLKDKIKILQKKLEQLQKKNEQYKDQHIIKLKEDLYEELNKNTQMGQIDNLIKLLEGLQQKLGLLMNNVSLIQEYQLKQIGEILEQILSSIQKNEEIQKKNNLENGISELILQKEELEKDKQLQIKKQLKFIIEQSNGQFFELCQMLEEQVNEEGKIQKKLLNQYKKMN